MGLTYPVDMISIIISLRNEIKVISLVTDRLACYHGLDPEQGGHGRFGGLCPGGGQKPGGGGGGLCPGGGGGGQKPGGGGGRCPGGGGGRCPGGGKNLGFI